MPHVQSVARSGPRKKGTSMRKQGGFTLTEMLVVTGIILVLAGILLPTLLSVKAGQLVHNCQADVEYLKTVLEQYKNESGDYPPSRLGAQSTTTAETDPNEGNMAFVRHLATTAGSGPYLRSYSLTDPGKFKITSLQLKDREIVPKVMPWAFKDPVCYRVMLDPWGMPYIYLHNRDYGSLTRDVYTVEGRNESGLFAMPSIVKAVLKQGASDADYVQPYGYQLWSCGPNRFNDNGTGDDIVSW